MHSNPSVADGDSYEHIWCLTWLDSISEELVQRNYALAPNTEVPVSVHGSFQSLPHILIFQSSKTVHLELPFIINK